MSVLIVGGGIGGLATAVALGRVGIDAHVFERAPEIQEVGAAVSIWSNAVKALRRMGLEERALSLGAEISTVAFSSAEGRVASSVNAESVSRACGASSIMVHRADLQRMLLDSLEPQRVNTAKECIGVAQDGSRVTVRFADGTEARGEVVIGADGIRSTVAASVFGDEKLRFAGYHCYRAMAETPKVPGNEALTILFPGVQFGLFPDVRPGETYWFLCRNSPVGTAAPDPRDEHSFRSILGELPRDFGDMVAGTDAGNIVVDDVFDRPRRKLWSRGRVSLLGDAAHPTTPTLGQGACLAIEDAVVLADSLQRAVDPVAGLREYEDRRRRRTAMTTRLSWRYGNILQAKHPALVKWRTLSLRMPVSRWYSQRMLRRLLSYDVPELRRSPAVH